MGHALSETRGVSMHAYLDIMQRILMESGRGLRWSSMTMYALNAVKSRKKPMIKAIIVVTAK